MADPTPAKRFRRPRGTADLLPEDQPFWRHVRETATRVAEAYGYGEIQTPVFEHAGVFLRPGAEGTDIVDREVYLFQDRGGDDLVLRPEGTAAVCRAYLENGMASRPQPVRLFYLIDSFRYDRPQAGRYRVFHQFGVEAIGEADASIDAEVIDLLRTFYEALGLNDVTVKLNSIGDPVCRPGYVKELRAYYTDKLDRLCADCRRRYDLNPLRLLDCKNEPCQPFKPDAPKIADHLCDACAEHFAALRSYLDDLGIPYTLAATLVRGLDYYTRTAFELVPQGAQSEIGGGGRYDGLIEQLGGKPTPGIGFGTGIERAILSLQRQGLEPPPVETPLTYVAATKEEFQGIAMKYARDIRRQGRPAIVGNSKRSLSSQLRHANALGARFALVIGPQEVEGQTVTLRDLSTSEQRRVPFAEAILQLSAKQSAGAEPLPGGTGGVPPSS